MFFYIYIKIDMYLFSVFNIHHYFPWFLFVLPKAPCHDFGSIQVCTDL